MKCYIITLIAHITSYLWVMGNCLPSAQVEIPPEKSAALKAEVQSIEQAENKEENKENKEEKKDKLEIVELTPADEQQRLAQLDLDSISDVPCKDEVVRARVTSVYDGDTCTVVFMLGNYPFKIHIRWMGIDCPEMKGKGVGPLEKQAATCVKKFVTRKIDQKIIWLRIHGWDKFGGRMLGTIYTEKPQEDTVSLNQKLINLHLARVYNGEKKRPWTPRELDYIISHLQQL